MMTTWVNIWYGETPIFEPYTECMRLTRDMAVSHGDNYKLMHQPSDFKGKDTAILKDQLLMSMALDGQHENCIFIDCDCYPIVYPNLYEGKPYFGFTGGTPDTYYVAVNGCSKFFHDAVNEFVNKKIDHKYGYWRKVLAGKDVCMIDPDSYIHLYNLKLEGRGNELQG